MIESEEQLYNHIDQLIKEYESSAEENFQDRDNPERGEQLQAKAEVMKELKQYLKANLLWIIQE
jgi:predicted XRE-type DNA-binding protein